MNFYYYPKDDSVEEFEPLSDDEGVDTNDIPENNQEQDDVVPMLEIDPTPCDEDYDNYDSERILQIDESIEEEPTEESGKDTKLKSDMNAFFGLWMGCLINYHSAIMRNLTKVWKTEKGPLQGGRAWSRV